jgi:hypothetical protein
VSTLRSALDGYASRDAGVLSDDELIEDVDELERISRVVEAERARRLAEIERRDLHRRDTVLSLTSWLAHRHGIGSITAARHVRLARALAAMPVTSAVLTYGAISVVAAELLASARQAHVDDFEQCEEMLVDLARRLPVRELRRAVEHWRCVVDAEADEAAAARRFERRGLFVSPTLDGMVRVDGNLDPETGQTVIAALRSIVDSWTRTADDGARSAPQRRADALGEVCRRYLESGDRPVVAGERPHLTITMDIDSLEGRAGRRCEFDDAGRISAEAARRLACDASITRMIVGPRSEPLDIGRRTPTVPASLRRALIVRDAGCGFEGCDRPPAWCDAHHVVHWADGGATSLSNLVLLCRRHHRAVHEGRARSP